MSGTTGSTSISDIFGYPVPDTWVSGQTLTADWLNRNIRDVQSFLAYAPTTTVTRLATQSLTTSVNTSVTFDTEVVDSDGMFTAPSTDIVIKRPGLYEIQTCGFFAASTAGPLRAMHININGNHTFSLNTGPNLSGNTTLNVGGILPLNAGDVINQVCFQSSGGALNVGGDLRHRLSVRLLSTAATTVTFTPGTTTSTSSGAAAGTSKKPTAPAPTKHTSGFSATFSRTFNSSGATTWDDSAYCYQGFYDNNRGNNRSIVGFNAASIQSALSGATKITGTCTFKVAHSYYDAGVTAVIGTHNYTTKPGSWSTTRVYENQGKRGSCVAGHTYTIQLTAWQCWAFQNGTITGMAFGPGPNTSLSYYGFMYGATQGGKPTLNFTYYK